jgi:hypothetical protein
MRKIIFSLLFCLVGCAQTTLPPAPSVEPADAPNKAGERALLRGLTAYENAQYLDAERHLADALGIGLALVKDAAIAHKHLAFLFCTSRRIPECESAFLAARHVDATFSLSRAEQGHPAWGPVYRRILP